MLSACLTTPPCPTTPACQNARLLPSPAPPKRRHGTPHHHSPHRRRPTPARPGTAAGWHGMLRTLDEPAAQKCRRRQRPAPVQGRAGGRGRAWAVRSTRRLHGLQNRMISMMMARRGAVCACKRRRRLSSPADTAAPAFRRRTCLEVQPKALPKLRQPDLLAVPHHACCRGAGGGQSQQVRRAAVHLWRARKRATEVVSRRGERRRPWWQAGLLGTQRHLDGTPSMCSCTWHAESRQADEQRHWRRAGGGGGGAARQLTHTSSRASRLSAAVSDDRSVSAMGP